MKTKNMYLNRLLKLARHLGKNHLNEVMFKGTKNYNCEKAGSNIEHFNWAISELPRLEPQNWISNQEGNPILSSHPELNALTGAAIFFGLSADELFHLFVSGYQDPAFSGTPLGDNASPSDLANNIYEFISLKQDESLTSSLGIAVKNNKEEKIIKKYKYKNVA